MNRADRDAAEAKMDRVDELLNEVAELNAEVNKKLAAVDRLMEEAAELAEGDGE